MAQLSLHWSPRECLSHAFLDWVTCHIPCLNIGCTVARGAACWLLPIQGEPSYCQIEYFRFVGSCMHITGMQQQRLPPGLPVVTSRSRPEPEMPSTCILCSYTDNDNMLCVMQGLVKATMADVAKEEPAGRTGETVAAAVAAPPVAESAPVPAAIVEPAPAAVAESAVAAPAAGGYDAKLQVSAPAATAPKVEAPKEAAKGEAPKEVSSSDYDATEHLMSMEEVGTKYGVKFSKENPGKSQGLSSSEVRHTHACIAIAAAGCSAERHHTSCSSGCSRGIMCV